MIAKKQIPTLPMYQILSKDTIENEIIPQLSIAKRDFKTKSCLIVSLLTESSQQVTNEEMPNAYGGLYHQVAHRLRTKSVHPFRALFATINYHTKLTSSHSHLRTAAVRNRQKRYSTRFYLDFGTFFHVKNYCCPPEKHNSSFKAIIIRLFLKTTFQSRNL